MSEHRLDKIVVERPRGGWRLKSPPGARKALQKNGLEGRKRESLRRSWKESGKTKYFSDNLGPLYGWLRSKKGQHWDDVYSELCQRLDLRTLSGQHILSHVWDYVERYVVIIDGVPYRKHYPQYQIGRWRDEMYIHPDTGILCLAKKPPKPPPKKRNDLVEIDPYHQYHKLDDIWYLITFRDVPFNQKVTDIVLQKTLSYWEARTHYDRAIYAFHKRHCTKKEIKSIMKQINQN
ncbi:MAG: hypothetical protein AB4426_23280 [Xenococcaceae cyanobacterium]